MCSAGKQLALLLVVAAALDWGACEQQQCASSGFGDATFAPRYCITDEASGNLGNVREVLELLGYVSTDNPADANIVWAWRDPFTPQSAEEFPKLAATHQHLRNLQEFQFVNQLPGLGYLATKPELARLSRDLINLPRTFELSREYKEWQEFLKTERGSQMEWIQKSKGHRGISIIPDPKASSLSDVKQDILVQQLIRPFLIDNRLWDVGVYVAVTSLEPLLAYVHTGGVLLRFCSQEYLRDITPDTPTSSYVIYGLDNYTPAKNVEGMKPHFADAGVDTQWGTTMSLAALKSYLENHGVDSKSWWLDVQSIILQVLQKTTPKMREQQAFKYTGQRTNFFTLLRFDFMLDEKLDTYLVEANMSPGLYRPDMPLEHQLLSRMLVHDLLQLKGLAPGGHHHQFTSKGLRDIKHHPDAVALGEPACANDCSTAISCNSNPMCVLCRSCRSEWQNGVLQRVIVEHQGSQGFMRIHPPHLDLVHYMELTGAERFKEVEDRPDDVLVRTWLTAKCEQDFRWC